MVAGMPIGRAPNYTFGDTCVTRRTYIQILFLFLFFVKRVQIIQTAAHLPAYAYSRGYTATLIWQLLLDRISRLSFTTATSGLGPLAST